MNLEFIRLLHREIFVNYYCLFISQDAEDLACGNVHVLDRADPALQASLQSEAEVNSMDAEQTFPTEEELAAADGLSI